jgi:hypothetical protein
MQRGFDFSDLQLSPPTLAMTVSSDRTRKSNLRRGDLYTKKVTVKFAPGDYRIYANLSFTERLVKPHDDYPAVG